MYFWTLPGPEGAELGGAVVAVETSLTMGCTLGTVVVTGEVVVEPDPGADVLRDRTWGGKEKQCQLPCVLPNSQTLNTESCLPQEPQSLAQEEQPGLRGPLGSAPSSSRW